MSGFGSGASGAAIMINVASTEGAGAAQPRESQRGVELRLHRTPPKAMNHTSTERSTWTTSAVRKKSVRTKMFCTYGARASTSSTEYKPEPTRSEERRVGKEGRSRWSPD